MTRPILGPDVLASERSKEKWAAGIPPATLCESNYYKLLLNNLPDVRLEKVASARSAIKNGTIENPERIDTVVARLWEDIKSL